MIYKARAAFGYLSVLQWNSPASAYRFSPVDKLWKACVLSGGKVEWSPGTIFAHVFIFRMFKIGDISKWSFFADNHKRSNVEFGKYDLIKLCFRQELRSLRSLPSLLCKLAVYAAVELFKAGFRKPNDRNGTQPEPCLLHNFICFRNSLFGCRAKRLENFEFY